MKAHPLIVALLTLRQGVNTLGLCYTDGMGVKEDAVEAVKCYRAAAQQRNAETPEGDFPGYVLGASKVKSPR